MKCNLSKAKSYKFYVRPNKKKTLNEFVVTLKEHVDRLFFIKNPPFALGIYSS